MLDPRFVSEHLEEVRAAIGRRGAQHTEKLDEAASLATEWRAVVTSLQTLPLNPRIAKDTLRYLARRQGARVNPQTEEQPGRIMHELRRGEMARGGEIPHVPYFGTIDACRLTLPMRG